MPNCSPKVTKLNYLPGGIVKVTRCSLYSPTLRIARRLFFLPCQSVVCEMSHCGFDASFANYP